MTRDSIFIPQYGWRIDLFLDTCCEDAYRIVGLMRSIGASDRVCVKAFASLYECREDEGFTYSSADYRYTVMAVHRASSFGEFLNTLTHENAHVCAHIVRSVDGDMDEETFCSLCGWLAMQEAEAILEVAENEKK